MPIMIYPLWAMKAKGRELLRAVKVACRETEIGQGPRMPPASKLRISAGARIMLMLTVPNKGFATWNDCREMFKSINGLDG